MMQNNDPYLEHNKALLVSRIEEALAPFVGKRNTEARRYRMERRVLAVVDRMAPLLPPVPLRWDVDGRPAHEWHIIARPRLRPRRADARILPIVRLRERD